MHHLQKEIKKCLWLGFHLPGCKNENHGALLKELMQTSNFRVTVVPEHDVVEICGALKVSMNKAIDYQKCAFFKNLYSLLMWALWGNIFTCSIIENGNGLFIQTLMASDCDAKMYP